ncbi:hypothetical protein ACFYVL_01540 [Streptomyces sp. NPDC004111]|uniref:hypothetical protein n=1 Tax=Streptomyces sp. NPDC004111 TaxID=3364690 RepID=UPI003687C5D6
MRSTQRIISSFAVVVALGAVAACGPKDTAADGAAPAGSTASATATAQPSGKPSADEGSSGEPANDCGNAPVLPAGHKMVAITAPPSKGSMTAQDTRPTCTPNDWIYQGQGEAKYYLFAPKVKAELSAGPGSTKTVPVGELWAHAGDCLTNQATVKSPYSCSGNIYDITLDGEGNVTTIKEVWHS